MEYKKTVKKYKNANSNKNTSKSSTKPQNKDQTVVANSRKEENKTADENKTLSHEGSPQPRSNSNLKEMQNQDTLAKNSKKPRIIYCIVASLVTIIAIALLRKNVFNKIFETSEEIWLMSKAGGITCFILFYIASTVAICLITNSNKTDNTAYNVNITLFTIVNILSFVICLLLYMYNQFLPACIILVIASIISIFLTYRYYVSSLISGILQTISTLFLLYGVYVTLAFTLTIMG